LTGRNAHSMAYRLLGRGERKRKKEEGEKSLEGMKIS
jgi:hypothetical protein